MLHTSARCFICFMCFSLITSQQPVVVTKMSPTRLMQSATPTEPAPGYTLTLAGLLRSLLFLLLTIVALFEQRSIFLIMFAIGVISWTGVTRLVRGEFIREREAVQAAIDEAYEAGLLGRQQHSLLR